MNAHYLTPNCTVLITGCSSGIGRYCAVSLKEKGYNVIATCRKPEDVQTLNDLGFKSFQLDLNCSKSINLNLEKILEATNGRIDVLFNNAGFGQPGAVEDLSREAIREQFETNLFGVMELTNKVIPIMRQHGHGKIIQNSSVLGFISMPFRGAYNASKYALEGLTDTLRLELKGSGIDVSTIEPGPIVSRFRQNAYQQFLKHIDKNNSAFKSTYENLEKRLSASDESKAPFTLGPEAVSDTIINIIKSKRPKPKYFITKPTYIFGFLKRILSQNLLDRVIMRVSKDELKQPGA